MFLKIPVKQHWFKNTPKKFKVPNSEQNKKTKLIQRQRLKRWTSAHVSESLIWWFAGSYGNEVTTKISKRKTKLTFGWNNVQLCPQLLAIGTSSTPLVKLSLHSNTSSPVYDLFGLRHILQLTWIWIRKQQTYHWVTCNRLGAIFVCTHF